MMVIVPCMPLQPSQAQSAVRLLAFRSQHAAQTLDCLMPVIDEQWSKLLVDGIVQRHVRPRFRLIRMAGQRFLFFDGR